MSKNFNAEYCNECFSLDQSTGVLTWKARPESHFATAKACKITNTRQAGKVAGVVGVNGYVHIGAGRGKTYAHRIVWTMTFGEIPSSTMIDHINHDRTDNRPDNLRLCNNSQNLQNQKPDARRNTSGSRNVYWHKQIGRPPLEPALPHDLQIALAKMVVLMARPRPQVIDEFAGAVVGEMVREALGAIESDRLGLPALDGPLSSQSKLKGQNEILQKRAAALETESKRQSKKARATRKKIADGTADGGEKTLTRQDLIEHQARWLLKPVRTIYGWKAAAKKNFKISTVTLNRILMEGEKTG